MRNVNIIDRFAGYQQGRGFSAGTIHRRTVTLQRFADYLAPKSLDQAVTVDVEEWLSTHRAPRTRHAYRSDLRVFYAWAVARNLLPTNPTVLVDQVKLPRALPKPIGPEILAALHTGRRSTRRMVALGLLAGLRCAEIAALDAADIDRWHTPQLLTVRNGKGGKDRVIPMHPMLAELLSDAPTAGPVFAGRHGGPIRAASASRTIRAHLERCGIDANPHRLRHTFGTEMTRQARGNLVAVAAVMGHESTNTTMGYVGWSGESAGIIAQMFTGGDAA